MFCNVAEKFLVIERNMFRNETEEGFCNGTKLGSAM